MPGESAILNWTLAVPAVGGLLVFFLPAAQAKRARPLALLFFAATLVLTIAAAWSFDWSAPPASPSLQLASTFTWIKALGATWSVGVDALSMALLLLTAASGFFACWGAYGIGRSPRAFCALLLWCVAALIGALIVQDLLLFFAFFQLAMVPLYFLIGIWGGPRKEYAASKFFLFSMTAAIALLAAVIMIYSRTHGLGAGGANAGGGLLNFTELATNTAARQRLSGLTGAAAFWMLLAAAAITMGAAPFHTWLGDVLAEAPLPVALLIVTAVTKLGAYMLFRIAWPLFPYEVAQRAELLQLLGALAIAYAALVAMAQRDLRRLVAFASVGQMGFFLLGLASAIRPYDPTRPYDFLPGQAFALLPIGAAGAAFLLFAHAISIGMAVLVAGNITERAGHCDIRRLGGLAGHMPAFAAWSAIAFLSAMGLPGLCVFVAQLLVLLGAFSAESAAGGAGGVAWLAVAGMVLLSAALLWTYQRIFMGAARPEHANVAGLSITQKWMLAMLGILALLLGVFPNPLLEPLRQWAEAWSRSVLPP